MKFTISASPHVKSKNSIEKEMFYVILALLPAAAFGAYLFGFNSVWIIIISISSALLTEALIQKLRKKQVTVYDGSAFLTGLLLALCLPPTVPLWIPSIGAAFAVAIGKHVFGGLGNNIFNPALIGRAFLVVSWPALMARYISPDGITSATPLTLAKETIANVSYKDLFLGYIGGSIGETSAVLLLIGALFLLWKKVISWRISLTYIATVFILSWILGKDPLFHLLAGGLIIGAFFMATDPVTSPITKLGRVIFGFGCGILTVILRMFSSYPEGVMFSILLMNSATPFIDRLTKQKPFGYKKPEKKKEGK